MTFRNIVLKMARKNYKKYLFYFICNTIVVMIFFMFSTLFFNEDLSNLNEEESVDQVLAVPAVALVVFTIFFIYYAHSLFIKKRTQEFALFMTLGMTKKDIAKLLQIENVLIIFSSIIVGLLFGGTFSRLFFLILMKGIDIDKVHFNLSPTMFFATIGFYLIIQVIVIGRFLYLILYRNLVENLKSDRVKESLKLESTAFGVFGIVLVVISIIGLYITSEKGGEYLYIWAMITFVGLYISLSQFMNLFVKIAKKNPNFYYSNITFITNIQYKFRKLSSIILLISIMFMITIWYSTILLFTIKEEIENFIQNNPNDIAYFQTETKNNIPFEDVKNILETKDNKIKEHFLLPVHAYYEYDSYYNWYEGYHIMPIDAFNKITHKQYSIDDNEFILFVNGTLGSIGDFEPYDEFTFPTKDGKDITFIQKDTLIEQKLNNIGLYDCVVVTNEQFEFLKENVEGFTSTIHIINMENWKQSEKEVEQLSNAALAYNQKTPIPKEMEIRGSLEEDFYEIESKILSIKRIQNNSGLQFFVTTFLSVLFFIGAFMLLYLNLFSDMDKEKKFYNKLYKIGITKKEIKKLIARDLRMVFFLPTVIGSLLALLYLISMAREMDGILYHMEGLLFFFIISSIYFIIQSVFYIYSKRKMVFELTRGD